MSEKSTRMKSRRFVPSVQAEASTGTDPSPSGTVPSAASAIRSPRATPRIGMPRRVGANRSASGTNARKRRSPTWTNRSNPAGAAGSAGSTEMTSRSPRPSIRSSRNGRRNAGIRASASLSIASETAASGSVSMRAFSASRRAFAISIPSASSCGERSTGRESAQASKAANAVGLATGASVAAAGGAGAGASRRASATGAAGAGTIAGACAPAGAGGGARSETRNRTAARTRTAPAIFEIFFVIRALLGMMDSRNCTFCADRRNERDCRRMRRSCYFHPPAPTARSPPFRRRASSAGKGTERAAAHGRRTDRLTLAAAEVDLPSLAVKVKLSLP